MSAIRLAETRDLPGIYRVCLQQGDSGGDATALFRNPDLLGHVYTGPFVVGEPDLAFVVADELGISGYALACADARTFNAWAEENWWPSLRAQYADADRTGADGEIIDLFFSPPQARESVLERYPAQMHIDLDPRTRGHGYGRQLIQVLIERLRERDVHGLHLDVSTTNYNAIQFYEHLGFEELERTDGSVYMGKLLD